VAYANAMSLAQGLAPAYDLSGCSGTPGTVTDPVGPTSGARAAGRDLNYPGGRNDRIGFRLARSRL